MAYYTKYNSKWYNVNLNAADSTKYPTADSTGRACSTTDYTVGLHQATGFYSGSSAIYTLLGYKITLTKNSNISAISLTYVDLDGTSQTVTAAGTYYAKPSSSYSWTATAATGYSTTTSGSGTMNGDKTVSPTASRISFTVSFAKGGSNYGSWSSTSVTAYYGDYIQRSGNTITIYKWDATSTARHTVTFTNGSATGYTYSVSYTNGPTTKTQLNRSTTYTVTATTSRTPNAYTFTFTLTNANGVATCSGYGGTRLLADGGTIYYGETITIQMYTPSANWGSHKLTSVSVTNNGTAVSASTNYYLTANGNSWTTTTSSSASTGLLVEADYDISSVTGNVVAKATRTNLTWSSAYNGQGDQSCGKNSSCSINPVPNANRAAYYPASGVRFSFRVYMGNSGTNTTYNDQAVGASGSGSLKYAGLSSSWSWSTSGTVGTNIKISLSTGSGGGAYTNGLQGINYKLLV